jgi:hypothetical protein
MSELSLTQLQTQINNLKTQIISGNSANGHQLFTSNGNFIVPETKIYYITAIGGGGGGAGGGGSSWANDSNGRTWRPARR